MKKYTLISLIFLLIINSIAFAEGGEDGKNKRSENYDHMNTAPKIKTAPHIQGVAANGTLEIFHDGKHHQMIIDKETDNILFDHLDQKTDYVRIYTDKTDGNKCLLIWRIKKVNKETGKITWKQFSYKHFEDIGWRPVDNRTTAVKSFE
ncbi:hypothetical protein KMW28_14895 [Flammeovirga yaeyamensis]|uniref:Secreted protein n=1 Tax=Flammeovirga yaeyamensis TaxID=367791 RepID=A0AAX1N0A5_9BACT|nr:hypothetical protein [Flammeovirga yaeyamensis]MBB3700118.1 hypothetical protein [Flammeovirga yaeyamensis]NMF37251.1 hypothetical protein [Flammeovirga yaeyamensis]QWG00939.1 hypothetical protein KMW28_14895 [Flammeovirga yaeyamensis]